jgi:hypothetical protein
MLNQRTLNLLGKKLKTIEKGLDHGLLKIYKIWIKHVLVEWDLWQIPHGAQKILMQIH